ncbi:MAG: hypothetical protein HN996_04655 [Opitutae bacterium]|nr:hypothetical protein [Opitutae bacterium]
MTSLAEVFMALGREEEPGEEAEALEDLPDEVHGVEYSDLEVMSGMMSDLMIRFFKEVTDEKMDKKDLPKLPYFMLGWTRGLPNGMVGHNRLYRKSEDE